MKLGDRLPVARAIAEFTLATEEDAACVRRSCPDCATHHQVFDLGGDFVHQFGCGTWNGSTLLAHVRAGRLPQACEQFLRWRFVRGYDCATPGNRRCPGVWTRAQQRHELCRGAIGAGPQ